MTVEGLRAAFHSAFRRALDAVDPERAVEEHLPRLEIRPPVTLLALGKAGPGMARAAHRLLGNRVARAVVVSDHLEPVPDGFRLIVGGHPLPDDRSLTAGTALLEAAAEADPDGTLLVLVSGGGSALAEVPVGGVTVEDLADLNRVLMETGVPIEETNLIRRHLSSIKDGGLLRSTRAPVVTLLVSDVIDGPASAIASGPTLADGSQPLDALEVLRRRGLIDRVAPSVVEALTNPPTRPPAGDEPHPPADTSHTASHTWVVVADCSIAARAAAEELDRIGIPAEVVSTSLRGEAAEQAAFLIRDARAGTVAVVAGETTVTVTGSGLGGRNQHAALAAAITLDGTHGVFAAFATDGRDGPTDAAGGVVDGRSAERMRRAGVDPEEALTACDSHRALTASGDLVVTGPTGTNVGDLWMVWKAA